LYICCHIQQASCIVSQCQRTRAKSQEYDLEKNCCLLQIYEFAIHSQFVESGSLFYIKRKNCYRVSRSDSKNYEKTINSSIYRICSRATNNFVRSDLKTSRPPCLSLVNHGKCPQIWHAFCFSGLMTT
jgi:hypothetical protein